MPTRERRSGATPGAGSGATLVPADRLSPAALRRLVEEFVTRDGTDYGEVECGLDEKVAQVLRQLDARELAIVFDPASQTSQLVTKRELEAATRLES